MSYTPTTWETGDLISSEKLNKIENGISAEEARAKAEEARIEALFTADVSEAVSDWLDEHPEATTSIEDGSLTEAKFTNALKLKAIKDYVTPQMFGAVADGTTDDTDALQDAINYAGGSGVKTVVLPYGKYRVTDTITVDYANMVIMCEGRPEYGSYISVPNEEFDVIRLNKSSCTIENLQIVVDGTTGDRKPTGIRIQRDTTIADLDTQIINCVVIYANIGVRLLGRNVDIKDCMFSNCEIGVQSDYAEGIETRGINITGCRFHGIGAVGGFDTDACCIKFPDTINTDFIDGVYQKRISEIKDNFCDFSATFFKGSIAGCIVENNIFFFGHNGFIDAISYNTFYQFEIVSISNNYFHGETLTSAVLETGVKTGVSVEDCWFIKIDNNIFVNTYETPVLLDNCVSARVTNNLFVRSPQVPTRSGYTNAYSYIKLIDSANSVIDGNNVSDDSASNLNAKYSYEIVASGGGTAPKTFIGQNYLPATNGASDPNASMRVTPMTIQPYVYGTIVSTITVIDENTNIASITLPNAGHYLVGCTFESDDRLQIVVTGSYVSFDATSASTLSDVISISAGGLVPCQCVKSGTVRFRSGKAGTYTFKNVKPFYIKLS